MGQKTPTGNWVRTTPRRGPDFVHKTVRAPEHGHVSIAKATLRPNSKRRAIGQARERMMHAMLAEIGINPVYLHGSRSRGSFMESQWTKKAKAWLDANQKRYAVA